MDSIFLEATNNIRAMHEIESILNNDDIPADSRSYFLQLITISLRKKMTPRQQKNVNAFRELFVRIDKDTRLFRTFLSLAVDLAQYFKFENHSIVYAFRNISLEDHFTSFVDFARRQNPIIEKNSPLQLFLTIGFAIIKLALQQNQLADGRQQLHREASKKMLLQQYSELSKNMSERFINLDFGEDIVRNQHKEDYDDDLDNFNRDDDDDDSVGDVSGRDNDTVVTFAEVHEDAADTFNNSQPGTPRSKLDVARTDFYVKNDLDEILKDIINDDEPEDHDSGFPKDSGSSSGSSADDEIFKTLENGDKELNLQNLDSLVMEASRQFGPAVLSGLSQQQEPVVRYQPPGISSNVQNIVDFMKHNSN